jgi:cobalt-zinc-cadmium efflux system outer membrane protein
VKQSIDNLINAKARRGFVVPLGLLLGCAVCGGCSWKSLGNKEFFQREAVVAHSDAPSRATDALIGAVEQSGSTRSGQEASLDRILDPKTSAERYPIDRVAYHRESTDDSTVKVQPKNADTQQETRQSPLPLAKIPLATVPSTKVLQSHPGDKAQAEHPAVVSLEQAEQIALQRHPELKRLRFKLESLHGTWVQVGLRTNPVQGPQSSDFGREGKVGQQGWFVNTVVPTGGKLSRARAVVACEYDVVQQQLAIEEMRVINQTRRAYVTAAMAERRMQASRLLLGIARDLAEGVQSLADAAEVSKLDVIQAQVEFHRAAIADETFANEFAAARRQLAILLGQPEDSLFGFADDWQHLPERDFAETDWSELTKAVFAASPDLQAAYAEQQHAAAALDLAQAKKRQDLQNQWLISYDFGSNYVLGGWQIGIPLPLYDRNQGEIHQRVSELAMSHEQIDRTQMQLQERLTGLVKDYQSARVQAERIQREILPRTEEAFDLMEQGYNAGESDFMQLAEAQQAYIQANLLFLASLEKMWTTYYQIDGLILESP